MPVLDTPQVVVQEVQTVKLLMVTATVVLTVIYLPITTAAQMLAVQEVANYVVNNSGRYYSKGSSHELVNL